MFKVWVSNRVKKKFLRPKRYGDDALSHENRNGNNLYAKTFPEEFGEIKQFLEKNPSEIVIIDLNGDWFEFKSSTNGLNYNKLNLEIMERFFLMFVTWIKRCLASNRCYVTWAQFHWKQATQIYENNTIVTFSLLWEAMIRSPKLMIFKVTKKWSFRLQLRIRMLWSKR